MLTARYPGKLQEPGLQCGISPAQNLSAALGEKHEPRFLTLCTHISRDNAQKYSETKGSGQFVCEMQQPQKSKPKWETERKMAQRKQEKFEDCLGI